MLVSNWAHPKTHKTMFKVLQNTLSSNFRKAGWFVSKAFFTSSLIIFGKSICFPKLKTVNSPSTLTIFKADNAEIEKDRNMKTEQNWWPALFLQTFEIIPPFAQHSRRLVTLFSNSEIPLSRAIVDWTNMKMEHNWNQSEISCFPNEHTKTKQFILNCIVMKT